MKLVSSLAKRSQLACRRSELKAYGLRSCIFVSSSCLFHFPLFSRGQRRRDGTEQAEWGLAEMVQPLLDLKGNFLKGSERHERRGREGDRLSAVSCAAIRPQNVPLWTFQQVAKRLAVP